MLTSPARPTTATAARTTARRRRGCRRMCRTKSITGTESCGPRGRSHGSSPFFLAIGRRLKKRRQRQHIPRTMVVPLSTLIEECLVDATETALLAGVAAAAADDAPRLVYADWLDETGRPAQAAQAEFIRRQCHDDPVCTWRQRELLRTYGRDWLRPLAEVMGLTDWGWNGGRAQLWGQRIPIGWEFSRGFPDEVTCPLGWWTGSYCPECGPARSAWQEVYYPLEPC